MEDFQSMLFRYITCGILLKCFDDRTHMTRCIEDDIRKIEGGENVNHVIQDRRDERGLFTYPIKFIGSTSSNRSVAFLLEQARMNQELEYARRHYDQKFQNRTLDQAKESLYLLAKDFGLSVSKKSPGFELDSSYVKPVEQKVFTESHFSASEIDNAPWPRDLLTEIRDARASIREAINEIMEDHPSPALSSPLLPQVKKKKKRRKMKRLRGWFVSGTEV